MWAHIYYICKIQGSNKLRNLQLNKAYDQRSRPSCHKVFAHIDHCATSQLPPQKEAKSKYLIQILEDWDKVLWIEGLNYWTYLTSTVSYLYGIVLFYQKNFIIFDWKSFISIYSSNEKICVWFRCQDTLKCVMTTKINMCVKICFVRNKLAEVLI